MNVPTRTITTLLFLILPTALSTADEKNSKEDKKYSGKRVTEWIKDSYNSESIVRVQAVHVLGEIAKDDPRAIPPLIKALKDDSDFVRGAAAWAVGTLGQKATPATTALISMVSTEQGIYRGYAARALGNIGDITAIETLRSAVKKAERQPDAIWIHFALCKLGDNQESHRDALLQALKDSRDGVRLFAVQAFGELGSIAKPAVATLSQGLKEKQRLLRIATARALADLGPDAGDAIEALIQALRDTEPDVRGLSARALGNIGQRAQAAIPQLDAALLAEREDVVSHEMREALNKIKATTSKK